MPFPSILRYFSDDLAIDLGTANTLVFTRNGGIVVREIRPGGEPGGTEPRWLQDEPSHLFGWVIARDRPLWRNDIAAELRFAESVPGDGMLSDMVIPLRARGRLIGAFRISCRTRHAFEPEDFHILERCADLTAVAAVAAPVLLSSGS